MDLPNSFDNDEPLNLRDKKMSVESGPILSRKSSCSNWFPDQDEISLISSLHEKLPIKDFHAEIRAYKDVDDFLNQTMLMLNVQESDLSELVDAMLEKALKSMDNEPNFSAREARQAIFTEDEGQILRQTVQGTIATEDCGPEIDQSWLCILCEVTCLARRQVLVARLQQPVNFGPNSQEIQIVILVMAPTKAKSVKSALETARTFSTLFMDMHYRHLLLEAETEYEFKKLLHKHTKTLLDMQGRPEFRKSQLLLTSAFEEPKKSEKRRCPIGQGVYDDLKQRIPHYLSDYKDGVSGTKTVHKVVSTTLFLYFACVLPNIAFGMLNNSNTYGTIGVKKILFSQCFGGLIFAIFGGQPLIVLLTTAPLALYTKVIYNISEDFGLDFSAMFACVGLWNALFLVLYSLLNLSKLMKFSSRSTEEIFSIFITFAFSADAIKDTIKDFNQHYYTSACQGNPKQPESSLSLNSSLMNLTSMTSYNVTLDNATVTDTSLGECLRENSILFLLLMLGTVWVGITLYNFTKTPFLNASKREMLADYALPVAVLFMSFFGSYIFRHISLEPFEYDASQVLFSVAPIHTLPVGAVFAAAGLGFSLSLLFFMDQNISSALVNNPHNKLEKGAAYHWDLMVVAIINGFLSIFTLPWIHAALPHSPLHVKALADLEDRVEQGHIHQVVVHVRETRLTGIFSHVMIGLTMFLLPYPMAYIPRPVLDGLFLYVAITALYGNQMFDRILLLFTEQTAYPPNHYIRRVPQKKIHLFTGVQMLQLLVLCVFGFSPWPYMKMIFPVLLMLLMPIRHKLLPRLIERKFLHALDGH